jgi:hypothetical protein
MINNKDKEQPSPADMPNKGKGMQGIDKAPGEEPAQSTENVIWETQKGKNKVDGDPEKESDRPIGQ